MIFHYVVRQNWQHIKIVVDTFVCSFVRASAVANISTTFMVGFLIYWWFRGYATDQQCLESWKSYWLKVPRYIWMTCGRTSCVLSKSIKSCLGRGEGRKKKRSNFIRRVFISPEWRCDLLVVCFVYPSSSFPPNPSAPPLSSPFPS
jgi:hypothetical protein